MDSEALASAVGCQSVCLVGEEHMDMVDATNSKILYDDECSS